MKSIKIRFEKKTNRLIISGNRIQSFNNYELSAIKDSAVHGIMKIRKEKEDQPVRLSVDLNGYISLKEYIKTVVMTEKLFVNVIESIITILIKAETKRFTCNLFVYKTDYVFVDVSRTDIAMIYIPLHPCESNGKLADLLSEIVRNSTFDPSEDLSYVSNLVEKIKKQDLTLYSMQEYLNSLKTGSVIDNLFFAEKQNSFVNNAETDSFSFDTNNYSEVYMLLNTMPGVRTVINKDRFSIGRIPDSSDLYIDSGSVSRDHAVIVKESGSYYVIDRFSKNGTFVNGKKVESGKKVSIVENDNIGFADCRFQFIRKEEI